MLYIIQKSVMNVLILKIFSDIWSKVTVIFG